MSQRAERRDRDRDRNHGPRVRQGIDVHRQREKLGEPDRPHHQVVPDVHRSAASGQRNSQRSRDEAQTTQQQPAGRRGRLAPRLGRHVGDGDGRGGQRDEQRKLEHPAATQQGRRQGERSERDDAGDRRKDKTSPHRSKAAGPRHDDRQPSESANVDLEHAERSDDRPDQHSSRARLFQPVRRHENQAGQEKADQAVGRHGLLGKHCQQAEGHQLPDHADREIPGEAVRGQTCHHAGGKPDDDAEEPPAVVGGDDAEELEQAAHQLVEERTVEGEVRGKQRMPREVVAERDEHVPLVVVRLEAAEHRHVGDWGGNQHDEGEHASCFDVHDGQRAADWSASRPDQARSDSIRFIYAQDAEKEAGKNRLHAERDQHRRGNHLSHRQPRVERTKTDRAPAQHRDHNATHAKNEHQRADREPGLELDVAEHRSIARVGRVESLLHREHFREDGEHDKLVSDQACKAGQQQSVDVEGHRSERLRPGFQNSSDHRAGREQ